MTTLNEEQLNQLEVSMRELDRVSIARVLLIAARKIDVTGDMAVITSSEYDVGCLVFGTYDACIAIARYLND